VGSAPSPVVYRGDALFFRGFGRGIGAVVVGNSSLAILAITARFMRAIRWTDAALVVRETGTDASPAMKRRAQNCPLNLRSSLHAAYCFTAAFTFVASGLKANSSSASPQATQSILWDFFVFFIEPCLCDIPTYTKS
jgi:hypothetical protein